MKKLRNGLIEAFCAVYAFAAAMLLFGQTSYAYIDPSVTTYVIQAVAGIVIALGAVIGVYWRKAKKKAQAALGIEDKVEQESDEIIVKKEMGEAGSPESNDQ